jgi:hypothetical protein
MVKKCRKKKREGGNLARKNAKNGQKTKDKSKEGNPPSGLSASGAGSETGAASTST